MREIIISTESGSDLPENLVKKYDIKVIPMHIVMDGTSYADGTISVDKIYEYYNETKKIPTTSAVNVGEYIDFFTQIREEHPDCVYYASGLFLAGIFYLSECRDCHPRI